MKSLIWQSVMWRPGKARLLIDMKNPLPIRPAPTARQHGPLRGRAVRQIRDVSRATPSLRHASGDTFSSRLTRASHPDRRAALVANEAGAHGSGPLDDSLLAIWLSQIILARLIGELAIFHYSETNQQGPAWREGAKESLGLDYGGGDIGGI